MRGVLALALALALACGGGGDTDTRASATGTLVYEPNAAEGTDREAFLATQAQVAESVLVAQRVAAWFGDPDDAAERIAAAVDAEPDPDAWIVHVTVRDPDPLRALERCNATLQGVVEARIEEQHRARQEELQALYALDEAAADDARKAELRGRIDELELAGVTMRTDVRILDTCR